MHTFFTFDNDIFCCHNRHHLRHHHHHTTTTITIIVIIGCNHHDHGYPSGLDELKRGVN